MSVAVVPEPNRPHIRLTHPADGVPDAVEPEIFQITNMFVAMFRVRGHFSNCKAAGCLKKEQEEPAFSPHAQRTSSCL